LHGYKKALAFKSGEQSRTQSGFACLLLSLHGKQAVNVVLLDACPALSILNKTMVQTAATN
jgi:hypothetical protein